MENPAQLNYKALAHSIQSGKCILVLGRGASTYLEGGQDTPIHLKLSRQLWEGLGEQRDEVNPDDLRHVSQVAYNKSGSFDRVTDGCGRVLRTFLRKHHRIPKQLAALPFQVCITTGPDDFLFKAFEDAGKKPVREYYDFRAKRDVAHRLFHFAQNDQLSPGVAHRLRAAPAERLPSRQKRPSAAVKPAGLRYARGIPQLRQ